MTPSFFLQRIPRNGSRRPWLLAALLLLVLGQALAVEHRHADLRSLHGDCSVCVLSATGGTAAFDPPGPAIAPEPGFHPPVRHAGRCRPAALRFCDSRAPPFH